MKKKTLTRILALLIIFILSGIVDAADNSKSFRTNVIVAERVFPNLDFSQVCGIAAEFKVVYDTDVENLEELIEISHNAKLIKTEQHDITKKFALRTITLNFDKKGLYTLKYTLMDKDNNRNLHFIGTQYNTPDVCDYGKSGPLKDLSGKTEEQYLIEFRTTLLRNEWTITTPKKQINDNEDDINDFLEYIKKIQEKAKTAEAAGSFQADIAAFAGKDFTPLINRLQVLLRANRALLDRLNSKELLLKPRREFLLAIKDITDQAGSIKKQFKLEKDHISSQENYPHRYNAVSNGMYPFESRNYNTNTEAELAQLYNNPNLALYDKNEIALELRSRSLERRFPETQEQTPNTPQPIPEPSPKPILQSTQPALSQPKPVALPPPLPTTLPPGLPKDRLSPSVISSIDELKTKLPQLISKVRSLKTLMQQKNKDVSEIDEILSQLEEMDNDLKEIDKLTPNQIFRKISSMHTKSEIIRLQIEKIALDMAKPKSGTPTISEAVPSQALPSDTTLTSLPTSQSPTLPLSDLPHPSSLQTEPGVKPTTLTTLAEPTPISDFILDYDYYDSKKTPLIDVNPTSGDPVLPAPVPDRAPLELAKPVTEDLTKLTDEQLKESYETAWLKWKLGQTVEENQQGADEVSSVLAEMKKRNITPPEMRRIPKPQRVPSRNPQETPLVKAEQPAPVSVTNVRPLIEQVRELRERARRAQEQSQTQPSPQLEAARSKAQPRVQASRTTQAIIPPPPKLSEEQEQAVSTQAQTSYQAISTAATILQETKKANAEIVEARSEEKLKDLVMPSGDTPNVMTYVVIGFFILIVGALLTTWGGSA